MAREGVDRGVAAADGTYANENRLGPELSFGIRRSIETRS